MKHIRTRLTNALNEVVEDIRFFDARGDLAEVSRLEACADTVKSKLEILSSIEQKGEGNIIRFNSDGTFRLWCVRIPSGGKQIIEHYDANISFDDYDALIEESDCLDVTQTFDIASISHLVIVTENIQDKRTDAYYFVSDDVIDDMRQ
jgi:hypothetical protein